MDFGPGHDANLKGRYNGASSIWSNSLDSSFPIGKLPPAFLKSILTNAPQFDERVVLGPGIGLDCAVIDAGDRYWVFKAEPITFATDQIGWYAVQVASNDIATTGALPRFMLLTLLLPEGHSDERLIRSISDQIFTACEQNRITVLGGHTEVTHGIDRPILATTLIGEVARDRLVTPRGSRCREHPAPLRPDLPDIQPGSFCHHRIGRAFDNSPAAGCG